MKIEEKGVKFANFQENKISNTLLDVLYILTFWLPEYIKDYKLIGSQCFELYFFIWISKVHLS